MSKWIPYKLSEQLVLESWRDDINSSVYVSCYGNKLNVEVGKNKPSNILECVGHMTSILEGSLSQDKYVRFSSMYGDIDLLTLEGEIGHPISRNLDLPIIPSKSYKRYLLHIDLGNEIEIVGKINLFSAISKCFEIIYSGKELSKPFETPMSIKVDVREFRNRKSIFHVTNPKYSPPIRGPIEDAVFPTAY